MNTVFSGRLGKHGNRRMACDLCRAQKLRCVISDPVSCRCDRCKDANLSCRIGPTGKSGRPRTKQRNSAQERMNIDRNAHNSISISPSDDVVKLERERGASTGNRRFYSMSPFTDSATLMPPEPLSFNRHEYNCQSPPIQYFNDTGPDYQPDCPPISYNEVFSLREFLTQESFAGLQGIPPVTDDDTSYTIVAEVSSIDNCFSMLSPPYATEQLNSSLGSSPDFTLSQASPGSYVPVSSLSDNVHNSNYTTDVCTAAAAAAETMNIPVRQYQPLAEFSIQAQAQIAILSQASLTATKKIKSAVHILDIASEVLEVSTLFYDSISLYFNGNSKNHVARAETESSSQSSCFTIRTSTAGDSNSPDVTHVDVTKWPVKLDIAMCLQLLASYFQFLELHEIFYRKACEYFSIECSSEHEHVKSERLFPTTSMSPDVIIGIYRLTSCPRFQWGILLRTSLFLLGRVETLLGLPEDCRIGSVTRCTSSGVDDCCEKKVLKRVNSDIRDQACGYDTRGVGVLEFNLSSDFIRTVFREQKTKTGEDKIAKIQELLDILQSYVIGSIR